MNLARIALVRSSAAILRSPGVPGEFFDASLHGVTEADLWAPDGEQSGAVTFHSGRDQFSVHMPISAARAVHAAFTEAMAALAKADGETP